MPRSLKPIPSFIGLLLGMAMGALDGTVVMTALPTMSAELDAGSKAGWIMTAYLTTATLTVPIWGKLSDAFGRRRLFIASVSLFIVASAACSLAPNIDVLIGVRAIQGLGGGGLMSLGLAAMGDLFSPRERGKYAGFSGLVFGGAMIFGPIVGGALAEGPGWPWIFLINLPFGIASLFLVTKNFHVPVARSPLRLDVAGIILLTMTLLAVLALLEGGGARFDWASPTAAILLVVSLAGLGLFIWRETGATDPLVPLRLFRDRPFSIAVAIGATVSAAQLCVFFLVPSFLQLVSGIPAAQAGWAMLPLTLATVVLGVATGRYVSASGKYKEPLIAGTAALAVGSLLLSRLDHNAATWYVLLGGMVAGAGLGMCNNAITVAAQNAVAIRDLGVGTSSLSLIRSLGQTLGVAAATAVLTGTFRDLVPASPDPAAVDQVRETVGPIELDQLKDTAPGLFDAFVDIMSQASAAAFTVALVASIAALLLALVMPRRELRTVVGTEHLAAEGERPE